MIARPFVVVEGPSDRAFWKAVVASHCPRLRPAIRVTGNKQAMIRKAAAFVRHAALLGHPLTVFIIDQHDDPSPADTESELRKSLHGGGPAIIGVAARALEAWMLADDKAVAAAFPRSGYKRSGQTDDLRDPERTLDERIRHHFRLRTVGYVKTDHAPKIAEHFDLKRAQQGSRSLRAFVAELRKAQKRPRR